MHPYWRKATQRAESCTGTEELDLRLCSVSRASVFCSCGLSAERSLSLALESLPWRQSSLMGRKEIPCWTDSPDHIWLFPRSTSVFSPYPLIPKTCCCCRAWLPEPICSCLRFQFALAFLCLTQHILTVIALYLSCFLLCG